MANAESLSPGADHSLSLRYNGAFIPEFFTTVLLSLPIAVPCALVPFEMGINWNSPHTWIAIVAYNGLSVALLIWTVGVRLQYRKVTLIADGDELAYLQSGNQLIELKGVERITERLGRFFGRQIRVLKIEDWRGDVREVNEAFEGYEGLKRALVRITGLEIELGTDRVALAETAGAWALRQTVLPPLRGTLAIIKRLFWRMACLIPVAMSEILVNVLFMFVLNDPRRAPSPLMLYCLPSSLVVSALIARYVYFYLFTSARGNMPIGARLTADPAFQRHANR